MKKKTSLQISLRMMTVVLILAALPLMVLVLNKKLSPQRNLASDASQETADASSDLSNLSPEEFKKAFKYEILKNVSLEKGQNESGLKLGLFFMKDANGNKVFVCDEYPYIDLIFTAEGMAFSGEVPQMLVRGPCVVSADQKHIEALPIPFHEILNSSTQKFEFQTSFGTTNKVQIYFRNVMGIWPTEWSWTGVTFYQKDPQIKLEISGYETISVLGAPLILKANE